MKKNTKKIIVFIADFIIKCITIFAVILLLHCPIAMVEAGSISGVPLIITVICSAWLGLVGIYTYLINR